MHRASLLPRVLGLLVAATIAGCSNGPARAPAGATAPDRPGRDSAGASSSPSGGDGHTASGADAAASGGAPDACAGLKDAFRARLAAATYACTDRDGCATSPGGIEGTGCGGVVDRETSTALFDLYRQIRERCALDFHCAARRVNWACRKGRCVEEAPPEVTPGLDLQPAR